MGLRGDARIETVSGAIPMMDLVEASSDNLDFSTQLFTWNGARLCVTTATDFRSLGAHQIFAVVLDDRSTLHVSAGTQFILRRGDLKRPPELENQDSLLPLYLSTDNHGYSVFKEPKTSQLRKLSWLVAEWKLGRPLEKGDIVNHIDRDRKNYHPDNLKITHNKAMATKTRKYGLVKAANEANELLDECISLSPKLAQVIKKRNHRVVSVEPSIMEEVFTATVTNSQTVAVSGVFLKLPSC